VLSYFSMPEGRVVNAGGTLKPEYIITDQQGNARFSFQDNGSGSPVIIQENSYYGFGAAMPNSLVSTPGQPNPNLYNGGSEWQNSFGNLPDYYQTGSRNYDPELGRFISVDPMAELSASLSNYHYAANNPIMGNDPTGNCDPNTDNGCPVQDQDAQPTDDPPANTATGGGGGGDPGTVYSGNSVPATSSSLGGTYNDNGYQLGTTGINFTLTLQGNWDASYNGLTGNTYDKQVVEESWVADDGFSYLRIGYQGISDEDAATYSAATANASSGNEGDSEPGAGVTMANQGGNGNSWFYNNDGTISNYAAGWGYVAGATGNQIGKIIQANSLYGAPLETTFVKTLVGNAEVSTNALRTTGTVLRTAGALAGVAGLGITAYQYANHQISGTEATIDGVFGVIGFIGPWGAAISIGYFGGKYLYEHYSGNTLYEKPTQ
jgi:RHS repeat-associated protein